MFEKSEDTMVFGLGLCNEPHSQDGKNTYAENVYVGRMMMISHDIEK